MQGSRHGGQLLLRRAGDGLGIEQLRGERVRGDVAGGDGGTGGGLRDLVAHRDAGGRGSRAGEDRGVIGGTACAAAGHWAGTAFGNAWASSS
ncbi:hypothetical protein ACFV0D_08040 [Streptomyces sp. NPDC059556]|uniref:hypothetical protein n=1 Tax=Streptomyces sp. NPDC059556 TaxID=3346863 RepID=UPI0036BC3873